MNLLEAGLYSSDPDIAEALYMLSEYSIRQQERLAAMKDSSK